MLYLLLAISFFIQGYAIYGACVEKVFDINRNRITPDLTNADGVDFVSTSKSKVYLIKLLNIAGVAQIFGAMFKRLVLALPLFIIGAILTQLDFAMIWRYFGVVNQTTAALMLWTAAASLLQKQKSHWMCTLPAMFMTTVVLALLFCSKTIGLGLPLGFSAVMASLITVLITFSVVSQITIKRRNS